MDKSQNLNIPFQTGNYGVSIIDYNNDGWDDIFITNTPRLLGGDTSFCVLLKNNGGVYFTDVTTAAGLRTFGSFKCGVWGDVNNDGNADLFLAEAYGLGRCHLFINVNGNSFKEVGLSSGINFTLPAATAAFGDYDNDGYVDLFLATEYPEFDFLYRNVSHGDTISFQDVTEKAGVGGYSSTVPMQVTFIDIDHDGDMDIYAVHDGTLPSSLFRNNGDGTFTDISNQTGLNDVGAGNSMGVYWKDYDFDGWEELYVTRIGKGGLYRRQENGKYLNIADSLGAGTNGMSWGVVWEDFDNDGDDDIFITSNYGYNHVRNLYYENTNGSFSEKGLVYGIDFPFDYYGAACGDFNRDGYVDLMVAASDGNDKLLLNTKNKTGNWVELSLTGVTVNRMAIGTTIRIVTQSKSQTKVITAGNSYVSQMSSKVHFGLGVNTVIDTVEITWAKNNVQTFSKVAVNEFYQVKEGQSLNTETSVSHKEIKTPVFYLGQNYPNPFNPTTTIDYSIKQRSEVLLTVVDILGRVVMTPLDEIKEPGRYSLQLSAFTLPSGIYFYHLQAGSYSETKRMIVLK